MATPLQQDSCPVECLITCPAVLSRAALLDFLKTLDREFRPPLSVRTDLDLYATKLMTLGTLATAFTADNLTGIAAMYCNNTRSKVAYVSIAGVLSTSRGVGVGRSLLFACAKFAKSKGMRSLELQADAEKIKVIQFYQKLGFAIVETYPRFKNSVAHRLQLDLTSSTAVQPLS